MNRLLAALVVVAQAPIAAAESPDVPRPIRHPTSVRGTVDQRLAEDLAAALRKPGDPSSPLNYVRIAVDVGRHGLPTHRLTRKRVVGEAQIWGRLLGDPERVAVRCLALPPTRGGIICMQLPREEGRHGRAELGLFLHFCRDTDLHLASVTTVTTAEDVRALLTEKTMETCRR